MKNLLIFCALILVAVVVAFNAMTIHIGTKPSPAAARQPNDTWLTDFSAAKQQAAGENKKLLLDFTGSDWCPCCQLLESQLLETDTFRNFAADYVLVRVDFPRSIELSPDVKQQNDELSQRFSITAFPTLVELDSSGQEITREVGCDLRGGSEAFLAQFK